MDKKIRKIEGIVTSDKMAKTVVVSVTYSRVHSKYLKSYKVTKKFKAHDEAEVCNVGDRAIISETRPLSRTKRWKVVECQPSKNAKKDSTE
jgi:small subunit ribosomal protein S17